MAEHGAAYAVIIPLLILIILVGCIAVVAFVAYQIGQDVANKTSEKMAKKNMTISKDGMKVGVREKSAEQVGDRTQSVLMKAWNASSWPEYKSSLGWGAQRDHAVPKEGAAALRKPYSRGSSHTSQ